MKAVLLLSGGLDSGTLLSKLVNDNIDVIPVSVHYGQRHSMSELGAAKALAREFGLSTKHQVLDISKIFSSSDPSVLLNSANSMPHQTYQELAETVGPSPTYVPFRNSILISMATAIALQNDAEYVYIATHAEDARNWAYPDCTPEFNGPMSGAVYIGSYMKVRLGVPFQWMMKREIVKLGVSLKAPFHMMWSCYEGGDRPCGKCPTCVERVQAFKDNGITEQY